ncbi:hypothetical protein LCGC14_1221640 [marine sediment metagenome]|uniref:Uncharacterized protein n=1 Tax=marine sediment metagenome TaxID=412755 RepID=A0A0F9PFK5_9ZZZZ
MIQSGQVKIFGTRFKRFGETCFLLRRPIEITIIFYLNII